MQNSQKVYWPHKSYKYIQPVMVKIWYTCWEILLKSNHCSEQHQVTNAIYTGQHMRDQQPSLYCFDYISRFVYNNKDFFTEYHFSPCTQSCLLLEMYLSLSTPLILRESQGWGDLHRLPVNHRTNVYREATIHSHIYTHGQLTLSD